MSDQPNSNSNAADSIEKLRHDLGAIIGNLQAFEILFFSQSDEAKRTSYKETYGNLMVRLDSVMTRLAEFVKAEKSRAAGGSKMKVVE